MRYIPVYLLVRWSERDCCGESIELSVQTVLPKPTGARPPLYLLNHRYCLDLSRPVCGKHVRPGGPAFTVVPVQSIDDRHMGPCATAVGRTSIGDRVHQEALCRAGAPAWVTMSFARPSPGGVFVGDTIVEWIMSRNKGRHPKPQVYDTVFSTCASCDTLTGRMGIRMPSVARQVRI